MYGRELSSKLYYNGMVKGIRSLALEQKLASAEEIAVMSEAEVCELVADKYDLVYAESECVGLVKKEDSTQLYKLLVEISR